VATAFLALAQRTPQFADEDAITYARNVMRVAAIADSLTASLTVEGTFIGRYVKGTVRNPTATPLEDVWLDVTDRNGKTRSLQLYRLGAGETAEVFELAGLAEGPITQVSVLAADLPRRFAAAP
jgi:hypothetical protein